MTKLTLEELVDDFETAVRCPIDDCFYCGEPDNYTARKDFIHQLEDLIAKRIKEQQ